MSKRNKLRVLQIFARLGVGGAETWLLAFLKHYRAHREYFPYEWEFDVLLTSGEEGVYDRQIADLGARLFYEKYSMDHIGSFARNYRRILSTGRYCALHDHQDYGAASRLLLGWGQLPPVRVVHVHNPLFCKERWLVRGGKSLKLRVAEKLLLVLATHIRGTSNRILQQYGLLDKRYAHLTPQALHCGFETDRFLGDKATARARIREEFGWSESDKILLFVGRLDTIYGDGKNHKNPYFALELARSCHSLDGRIRLLVVGSGAHIANDLRRLIADYGLPSQFVVAGVRHDIPVLMNASDLLLFPSEEEGLGMVAVEAQAAGLRVLASTRVPTETKVIPSSVVYCPLESPMKEWVSQVRALLATAPLDAEESNRAVKASAFSISQSAANLIELYSQGVPDHLP